ncbi:MAG: HAD-IB family hydrolase [Phycisphaerales bacterium]|nr:HAD-IB family hydrolase [Phycisphaerales bacterium]
MPRREVPGGAIAADATGREAAFFDVDGTLVATHIVHQFVHVRRWLAGGGDWRFRLWLAFFYARCLRYAYLDRVSRTRMNIAFYRNYAGLDAKRVREAARDCLERVLRPNLYREALACVTDHVRRGHRIVLVTGSIDFLIEPLAGHLREVCGCKAGIDVVARTLVVRDGRFTGELDGAPLGESEKARELAAYAERVGIDLARSCAYGDSVADVPMMGCVGHATAVNPRRALRAIAHRRGWSCVTWSLPRNRG